MTETERIDVEKSQCLLTLEHLHRRDLAFERVSTAFIDAIRRFVPLIILQNIHEAILDINELEVNHQGILAVQKRKFRLDSDVGSKT